MNPADLTFVVLTKDEARHIEACLGSVPRRAHALVYDSGSVDDTTLIARTLGADVIEGAWRGFARTRLDALAHVATPWTFMLDADERLTPELRAEIAALDPPGEVAGYSLPRKNMFCGRWIRGAGWWPDRLVRLFRTDRATIPASGGVEAAAVHEVWQVDGAVGSLASPLVHESYSSLEEYRRKFADYTALEAANAPRSVARAVSECLCVPARLAWLLVGKRAILDGWQGWYVAAGSAVYRAAVPLKALRRA